ncbi:hypothetical protein ABZ930_26570 [Streptomyces sp. NPDC046716]|uniref:hypothetical protein n=1 Tax=Streptomyces sp. NPDC046716 TaxID=3157093 RepID=UPI0033D49D56
MSSQRVRVNPQIVTAAAITLFTLVVVTGNASVSPATWPVTDVVTEPNVVVVQNAKARPMRVEGHES